jgi:hypothetical protein
MKEASLVTCDSSTPSCSATISLILFSTDITVTSVL